MSTQTLQDLPPQPAPSLDSRPFWDYLKRGELAVQRCTACKTWSFPLMECCRECGGALEMTPLSGRATIYTFIVQHQRVAPGFDALRPYPIALLTPEEAPHIRLPARLVGATADKLHIGAPVQIYVESLPGGDFNVALARLV